MPWLIKSDDVPREYGKYPGSRSIEELIRNGIIILDKWPGPTSHDVSAVLKKVFNLKKTAHSGTLDPAVSGVLPIMLENACKIMPALQKLDKEYVGVMHLHKDVSDSDLEKAVKKFTGEIKQTPPKRSAVARKERMRRVYSFELLDRQGRDVVFRVNCQAGTYIRKLIDDLGKKIGGAHMAELRRTKVGRFDESKTVRIQDVVDAYEFWKEKQLDAKHIDAQSIDTEGVIHRGVRQIASSDYDDSIRKYILPVEAAIEHLGKVIVKDSAVAAIANGSPLYTAGICKIETGIEKDILVALLTLKGELIALASADMSSEEMLHRRGIAAKTDKVIMDKGIYPKF